VTVPLPLPDAGDTLIQLADVVAVHAQVEVTLIVPLWLEPPTDALADDSDVEQVVGAVEP
jgi:hypothetical protein